MTLFTLATKNLTRARTRNILTAITIIIGVCALFLSMSLSKGIKDATFEHIAEENPLNQITVTSPSNSLFTFLDSSDEAKSLTDETIQELSDLPEVTHVYPEMSYASPSSLEVELFGKRFQTDTMIYGVPYEFLKKDLEAPNDWSPNAEVTPGVISKQLLDVYNLSIAQENLPRVNKEMIIGQRLSLYPGFSSFFASVTKKSEEIPTKIIALSYKTSLVGITLPLEKVKAMNKKANPNYQNKYVRLYLTLNSGEKIDDISKKIEALGYETTYLQKRITAVSSSVNFLTIGFHLIGLIILIVALLSITNTFFSHVYERTNEIGLLRALGATHKEIRTLFIIEASILGALSSITGILIGIITIPLLNLAILNSLPEYISFSHDIVSVPFIDIPFLIVLTILLSALAAYLPARKAGTLQPIQALNL